MSYFSAGEAYETTSSEDGEQEPLWEVTLVYLYGCSVLLACRIEQRHGYCSQRRERTGSSCLRKRLEKLLILWVVSALWPIFVVIYFCPPLWRITAARIDGMRNVILERYTRGQENEAADTSRTDNSHWHRRGWLVLLRARHQRIAAASVSSKGRWTGCCRKQNGLPVGVVPHRDEDDIEGGQGRVAKDIAASRFRQLLMRVVEHEEDGVFRSIVGYL